MSPGQLVASPARSWLVGSKGLYQGEPRSSWRRLSVRQYTVLTICRGSRSLYLGTTGGLWEVRGEEWIQRHDETLTEVLAIARLPGSPGLAAGCPYGIATATEAAGGAWRWSFHDEGLGPNQRFTSAILRDPRSNARLLVGTEAGLSLYEPSWPAPRASSLQGSPVRALLAAHGSLWAGTDTRGVFRSTDGEAWRPAGAGLEEDAVLSLAAGAAGTILAGTARGIARGDGEGRWRVTGPRLLVSALAAAPHGTAGELWLAGASPGGLWYSEDRGEEWHHIPGHAYVRAVAAPAVSEEESRNG